MKPLILIILALSAYLPLLGATTVSPDAHIILRPLLDTGFFQYLEMLKNFGTVDFQPVRDLTFFIDIAVFKIIGFNSFALTNVILWGLGCSLIYRLLRRQYPGHSPQFQFLATVAFTVYPLFSQAVSWSMARKHVLAFVLILSTTHFFFDWIEGKKKWGWFFFFYVMAVLSQPITVFWPLWAVFHLFLIERQFLVKHRSTVLSLFLSMLALLLTNYAYYTVLNDGLREYYTQAKPEFSLYRLFLHASFYFRQLVWPYQLSFVYYPTIQNSWMGTVIAAFIVFIVIVKRKDRSFLSWIVFALAPFPVFLGISVYDQYLILPATGLMLAFLPMLERFRKIGNILIPVLILVWGTLTYREASTWTKDGSLWLRNFETAPSCRSVIQALSSISLTDLETPRAALEFYRNENCFSVLPNLPPAEKPKALVAQAVYLFHSSDKSEELKLLGQYHYFPLLLYSVKMAQENDLDEVRSATDFIFDKVQGPLEETGPLVQNTLGKYCREKELAHCLKLLQGPQTKLPYK